MLIDWTNQMATCHSMFLRQDAKGVHGVSYKLNCLCDALAR